MSYLNLKDNQKIKNNYTKKIQIYYNYSKKISTQQIFPIKSYNQKIIYNHHNKISVNKCLEL